MTANMDTLPKLTESNAFIDPKNYAGKLKGKVVVITGASAGIGQYICRAFAAAGASVACVARRESEITKLAEEIKASGGHAIPVAGDVAAKGSPKEIISTVEGQLGPIDILINNAGIARIGALEYEDEDLEKWWRVYEVNVKGPVSMIRAVLPSMLKRKTGIIATVSSNVATLPLPAMAAYNSSKAAISKFHEGISYELEDSGVLTFALHPGQIESDLGKAPDAINKESFAHPAVKKFIASVQDGGPRQTADMPSNVLVAMACDPRAKFMHGRHVNSDQDLEEVLKEAEKDGKGRIGKDDLYFVRIHSL